MFAESTYYGLGAGWFTKLVGKKGAKTLKKVGRVGLGVAAAGAVGYGAYKFAPGASSAIANWFKASGASQGAAQAAAQQILAGQAPMPADLQAHLQQAGMFDTSGWMLPALAIGGLGLVAFVMLPPKKRRR